jgi:hypothetical protein
MIAAGSYPAIMRRPITVTGTTRKPSARSSSYAASSSSTYFTVKSARSRESNSFT